MKQVLNTFIVMIVLLPFVGCYTELATVERNDRDYAYDSDTTGTDGSTTINNNYYLDDSYRQSRMRVSFNYYSPTYSSWIGSYYHSYFDDYSWGMYHRPSWYYDPFYTYYPPYGGCMYPSPYYDPWYPYYPVAYYPGYYPSYNPSTYGTITGDPGRTRNGGASREPLNDDRSRPIPGAINIPVATAGNPENRPRIADDGTPTGRPTRNPEKPWWEKMDERATRNAGDSRPIDVTKGDRPRRDETTTINPPVNNRPVPNREDRPIDRNKPNQPTIDPGKTDRQPEARPAERPRSGEVRYSPPVKSSVPQDEAHPVQRPRESSRPSYNPAPQSAPPQSAPPRSSGGSSNGGGRKRD